MIKVRSSDQSKQSFIVIDDIPKICPFCHNSIRPNVVIAYIDTDKEIYHHTILNVLFNCPHSNCRESFIGYYTYKNQTTRGYEFIFDDKVSIGNLKGRVFNTTISDLSNSFVKIYNQSLSAEQMNLNEICGVGYRKALEFLIKDYAIHKFPSESDRIEKKMLAQCIGDYVSDDKIKSVAKRAVWIGNDETHYVRKWEGKSLTDLKKLIDLTLHWIEAELLTESFELEMPE